MGLDPIHLPDPLITARYEYVAPGRRVRGKSDLALMLRGEQFTGIEFVSDSDARAIEVHVANLRRKLGESPTSPR